MSAARESSQGTTITIVRDESNDLASLLTPIFIFYFLQFFNLRGIMLCGWLYSICAIG